MNDDQLCRATATIERQVQDINDLQDEVARLRLLRQETSGDVAARLVRTAIVEEVQKRPERIVTFTLNKEYTMTINGTHYTVRITEKEDT